MSDGELRPGTALFLRGFKDHPNDLTQLSFPAPKEKGRYHLAIWLGTWKDGEPTATERLNKMGWFYDPDRTAKAIEAEGGDAQSGSVRKDESAVGKADLPDNSGV